MEYQGIAYVSCDIQHPIRVYHRTVVVATCQLRNEEATSRYDCVGGAASQNAKGEGVIELTRKLQ